MKKTILIIIACLLAASSQTILPISTEIMREVQREYRRGEIDEYVRLITGSKAVSDDEYSNIEAEVSLFFESSAFLETGAAYLTALFTERELTEVLAVLKDGSLKNNENYGGARKLDSMLKQLKPYIVKYLRQRTS